MTMVDCMGDCVVPACKMHIGKNWNYLYVKRKKKKTSRMKLVNIFPNCILYYVHGLGHVCCEFRCLRRPEGRIPLELEL